MNPADDSPYCTISGRVRTWHLSGLIVCMLHGSALRSSVLIGFDMKIPKPLLRVWLVTEGRQDANIVITSWWYCRLRLSLCILITTTIIVIVIIHTDVILLPFIPVGTGRNNNVFITSKRRRRRSFDEMKTLSLRHYCVMCPLGCNESSQNV